MPWIAARICAVLLTMSVFAEAGPPGPAVRDMSQIPGVDIATIGICVRQVRQASSDNEFDAYLRSSGMMRVTGTDDEVRHFKACLRDDPTSDPTVPPSMSATPRPHSRQRDASSREPAAPKSSSRRP